MKRRIEPSAIFDRTYMNRVSTHPCDGCITALLLGACLVWCHQVSAVEAGKSLPEMSNAELVEALADPSTPPNTGTDILPILKTRLAEYSKKQVKQVGDAMVGIAGSLEGFEKRRFVINATFFLPAPEAVRVMKEVLLTTGDDADRSAFVGAIMFPLEPCEEAAETLFVLYNTLCEELEMEHNPDKQGLANGVLSALGECGRPGFDRLVQLGWKNESGIAGMGKFGTAEAIQLLIETYTNAPRQSSQAYCLVAMTRHGILHLPEEMRTFIREAVCTYLSDDNAGWRGYAIAAAGNSKDPYFIPFLEELAETDPRVNLSSHYEKRPDGSGEFDLIEGEEYVNRRAAREAIENIRMFDPAYARARTLEQEIASLKEQLGNTEAELASGALSTPEQESWTTLKGYLEAEIAKRETELAGLGSSPTPPSP